MNCRTQVIVAAGIGYLLGRQRKLRWGLTLAAAAAAGRISGPGDILQRGVKALASSPGLGGLTGLGAPLVAAGKDAAKAAVTGQIDSVTGRLRDRAEGLRRPGGRRKEPDEQPDEEPDERRRRPPATRRDDERPPERPRRRPRAAREERDDVYEEEAEPSRRRPPAAERDDEDRDERRDVSARDEADDEADDEPDDEEYDEPPEEEAASLSGVGRSRPDVGSRSPVHRRGR
ncbi:hypothetical protein AB0K00_41615 [Dactylosporangium sp. NPDC049525]|uniref:hypothetical protein n=1 Tax=Dactylosporangium sp. NPDC049525 TaxID=3154730 RepID=UPI0034263A12